MPDLETRIKQIEQRNKRVEADKAWETSLTRKLAIVILTYLTMTLVMTSLNIAKPFLNALVPTLGFFLSTLSLPFIKNLWIKHFYS